jgi:DNA-binding MarR family transcriptional regulator
MNKNEGRFRFTIEERILLHLLDFVKYRNEIEVPSSITQGGIAEGIGIKKKHVPRSLKAMIEKDLLTERTTHVKGKPQRMKTYFLTLNGEERARRLRNHVKDITIKVKEGDREIKELAIRDLGNILRDSYTLAQIVSHVSSDGIFNIKEVKETREEEKKEVKRDDLQIYKKALTQVWKDGKMSNDERDILHILRDCLNVSNKEHLALEEEILENAEKGADGQAKEIYKVALEQALEDGKITDDERAILEKIKKKFKIEDE